MGTVRPKPAATTLITAPDTSRTNTFYQLTAHLTETVRALPTTASRFPGQGLSVDHTSQKSEPHSPAQGPIVTVPAVRRHMV